MAAEPTLAEGMFQNTGLESAAVVTPPGTDRNSDTTRIFTDRLRDTMRDRGPAASAEAAAAGPPGITEAIRNRLMLRLTAAQRGAIDGELTTSNQLAQRGINSFDDADRDGMLAVMEATVLNNSGYRAAFEPFDPDERTEVAMGIYTNEHFLTLYDRRLKEIANRDVNPTEEQRRDRANFYKATTDSMERALVERIARQDLMEAKIAVEIAGLAPRVPARTPAEDRTLAIQNLRGAGTLIPDAAAIDARADALQLTPNDPTLSQIALETIANEDMIAENQTNIVTDIQNIEADTLSGLQQEYAKRAGEVARQPLGKEVVDRRMDEILTSMRRWTPDAYGPAGAALESFNQFIHFGAEYFVRDDPDALDALRRDPALKKKFSAELAQELTFARLRVKNPPPSEADYNRMASSKAYGETPLERIKTINKLFETTQIFKDVRESGKAGGMLDRDTWDKIIAAVRKSPKPVAIIGAVLAILAAVGTLPVSGAVVFGTLGLAGIAAKGRFIDLPNDAKGRRYSYEPD